MPISESRSIRFNLCILCPLVLFRLEQCSRCRCCQLHAMTRFLSLPTANSEYALVEGSQAIDLGLNDYLTVDTDLAGNARVINSVVDLGAYENHCNADRETSLQTKSSHRHSPSSLEDR